MEKEIVNIIVVDDHTLFRQGLKKIFDDHTWIKVIGETDDGNKVLELVEKLRPDIIIMDISLRGSSGIKVTSLVKERYPLINVLILTMHKSKTYFCQALNAGASGYVLKDSADTELLLAISALHKGDKYVSPLLSDIISDIIIDTCPDKPKDTVLQKQKYNLSPREREVLKLICAGNSNKEVAYILNISVRTVEHHRNNIMRKLGIHEIANLVKYAIEKGLIDL